MFVLEQNKYLDYYFDSDLEIFHGFILDRNSSLNSSLSYIKTADCLPIIIASKNKVALLHAGWKGLKAGILENAISYFKDESKIKATIGAHASFNDYEVQEDFLSNFTYQGLYKKSSNSKYKFSLERCAKEILINNGILKEEIKTLAVSTITNSSFNSYRRSPDGLQRNISFLML